MKLRRLFTPWAAAALLPFMGGCNTYLQQKADVVAGGPERRVQAAEERRQAAEDSRQGLESDREALEEELALQERQIAGLDRRLEDQDARIAQAGRENRITRESRRPRPWPPTSSPAGGRIGSDWWRSRATPSPRCR